MSFISDHLAHIIEADGRGELAHDQRQEHADRYAEKGDTGATDLRDCPQCGGGGEVVERGYSRSPYSGVMAPDPQEDVGHECPTCRGEGMVSSDVACRNCGDPFVLPAGLTFGRTKWTSLCSSCLRDEI